MNYVYILKCADDTLYTGWTNNLNRRIAVHNSGNGAKYTRARLPVALVYYKKFSTRSEAMSREYYIKQMSRKQKERLVKNFERSKSMERIESFEVDHLKLLPGVYVSRKDTVGESLVTTFDLRMTEPNKEPVMNTATMHTIEHIGATYLRNHATIKDQVIYFGPMGCRTGFYLILSGVYESKEVVDLLIEMFDFIKNFEGEIPGASAKECGNYLDQNMEMAKYRSEKYLEVLKNITKDRLEYS